MQMKVKTTSLVIALMTSTFLNAYAMYDGDSSDEESRPSSSTRSERSEAQYRFEVLEDMSRTGKPKAKFRITRSTAPRDPDVEILDLKKVKHLEFEAILGPNLSTLDPFDPLPQDLGSAKEKVHITFLYKGKKRKLEFTRPKNYNLVGRWEFEDDHSHAQTKATLELKVLMEDRVWRTAYERSSTTPHNLRQTDPEIPGQYYFDGDTVYQAKTKLHHYINTRTQRNYTRNIASQDGEVLSHAGNQIVYVEPFAYENNPLKPRENYIGEYTFVRDVEEEKKLPRREAGRFIYSDGNNIYETQVTQELWRQGQEHAGFFIASYKQSQKLNFMRDARIPGGHLTQGLYQLRHVEHGNDKRIERWMRLGDDPREVAIETPFGLSSIPGIGMLASHQVIEEVPSDQAAQEVLSLQAAVQEIEQKTDEAQAGQLGQGTNPTSVIIVGPSGCGKTTFIHGLAEIPLVAESRSKLLGIESDEDESDEEDEDPTDKWVLSATRTLPGFDIGHGYHSGTKLPSFWHDSENNINYWDSTGFEDPGNEKRRRAIQDIVNAFSIKKLFEGPSGKKILLDVPYSFIRESRATAFLKLLDKMTKIFPNDEDLKESLSLIIKKQGNKIPLSTLKRIKFAPPPIFEENPRVKTLFEFLLDNRKERIFIFPTPVGRGEYRFNREEISGRIKRLPSAQISFRNDVEPASLLTVGSLATRINKYLADYIGTEGSQRIAQFCQKKVDNYSGSIAGLRTWMDQLIQSLRSLQAPTMTPDHFTGILREIQGLGETLNIKEIESSIEQLKFLKGIKSDVEYDTSKWATALYGAIEQIETLKLPPKIEYKASNRVLTIKGALVGASDVVEALRTHQVSLSRVDVFGLNTLLIDTNITSKGTFLSMISPQWRVVGQKTIDLSGNAGTSGTSGGAGEDGLPGGSGGNGGNFYGKGHSFYHLDQLTINTNGGQGGSGGNGGNGINGTDGTNGALTPVQINETRHWTIHINEKPTADPALWEYFGHGIAQHEIHYNFINNIYNAQGTNGTLGGNSGKRGTGGLGGNPGIVELDGTTWIHDPQYRQTGASGADGAHGTVGIGGTHGQHCVGNVWTGVTVWDDPWKGHWALPTRSHHNRTLVAPGHAGSRGKAADGIQPADLNTTGQQQPDQRVQMDQNPSLEAYAALRDKKASLPKLNPFIKVFPSL